jgi:hypothetical protein
MEIASCWLTGCEYTATHESGVKVKVGLEK